METTCIVCPIGCNLKIENINGEIVVSGNLCPRGAKYGKSEMVNPTRIVTCSFSAGEKIYFTKTSQPIPKDKIFDVIKEIKKSPIKNYQIGDIVIENVLNTGANIVITGWHKI